MNKWFFDAKDILLENGIRVITIKKDIQLASIQLGVKAGPIYEEISEKGISHFIEHMLFKGTNSRSNEELNDALEFLGGEYNAYTDYSCTVYSITALEEELENSMEILSDMIINSNFPKKEIEKEKGVVISEIRTSKDDIEDFSFKMLNQMAFTHSALKYDVSGTEKNVKSFSREKIIEYFNKYYVGNNATIVMVSSLDHEEARNLVSKYFGSWKRGLLEKKSVIAEKNKEGKFITEKKDIEQVTITYLYTFHDLPKELELALRILNHKLGESANSILFREVRENRGLAYDIYTHVDMTKDLKTLCIYTSVAEENIEETLQAVELCIKNIKEKNITFNDKTMELMKKVHKTAVVSTLEDSADLANYVLHQSLEEENIYGFIKDMEDLNQIVDEDIYRVADLVLNNPTIHILKPNK